MSYSSREVERWALVLPLLRVGVFVGETQMQMLVLQSDDFFWEIRLPSGDTI